ncbi:hypothetical protein 20Sep420_00008 [Pseudomonas phage 20Sep420]|nr:hypothetical protein 20Sep420_00008 [Pseudomonas phage 20Sep420]
MAEVPAPVQARSSRFGFSDSNKGPPEGDPLQSLGYATQRCASP